MTDLIRTDPWSLVPRLHDEVNRIFRSVASGLEDDSTAATAAWIPPVDIFEYEDRFELFVDLPGVDPTDVDLTLEEGVLTVSGTRTDARAAESSKRNGEEQ
ncbi:MAG: Hsp20 family protein, partial [Steroidobacteraceae bacterium]|nr:Hsp20 family protein [Steroidobacteraceae bacterium]